MDPPNPNTAEFRSGLEGFQYAVSAGLKVHVKAKKVTSSAGKLEISFYCITTHYEAQGSLCGPHRILQTQLEPSSCWVWRVRVALKSGE